MISYYKIYFLKGNILLDNKLAYYIYPKEDIKVTCYL